MKTAYEIVTFLILSHAILLMEGHAQNVDYFISPPTQTNPIVINWSDGTNYVISLDKDVDFTLNITNTVVGNISINGGRHIRVYGNGNEVSGQIRLANGGGTSNSSGTSGMGEVGAPGSFYIEGVYWPKYKHLYGSPGARQDCIAIYNNNGFGDGRKVNCVIIQRCGAFGIWGGDNPLGHGDFYQVQGTSTPLIIDYTYISACTVSTGYTGFQYYKHNPGGDGTLKDNPRMRMVNMNWKRYFYTDQSTAWCNVNPDGTPKGGSYFAIGLNNQPNNQPGPGLHIAVHNTYAERNMRNGVEKVMFNPNGLLPNNLVYEYKPGDGTLVLNDYATRQKSVYMLGAIIMGAPPQGDFMPETAFDPGTWKNIGDQGGPSFFVAYQDGKLPEEMGIPFTDNVTSANELGLGEDCLLIYPVPASDNLHLKVPGEIKLNNGMMAIFDQSGRKLMAVRIDAHEMSISSGNLQPGIYYYSFINNETQVSSGKLLLGY